MKNNITELVMILDKSGSMHGLEADTIGGFNAMIEKQKNVDGKCYVSCVLFDNASHVIYDRADINSIKPLTSGDYIPGGCTALTDALGGAVKHIGNIHKYIREEDVPEHTIFVIITDGMENASHKYTSDKVKKMIRKNEKENEWEFLYLAANIDAVETGKVMGFREDRSVNYKASSAGTTHLYDAVGKAVNSLRCDMAIPCGCFEQLEEDAKN